MKDYCSSTELEDYTTRVQEVSDPSLETFTYVTLLDIAWFLELDDFEKK